MLCLSVGVWETDKHKLMWMPCLEVRTQIETGVDDEKKNGLDTAVQELLGN